MLEQRLKKRYKHLKKWAAKQGISCFRLYEKDIPEYPCTVDWYDGDVVVWMKRRTRDEDDDMVQNHVEDVVSQIAWGLERKPSQIFVKERYRQKRNEQGRDQYQREAMEVYTKEVAEQGLKFFVNLSDYLDTGLFIDHRVARSWVRDMAKGLDVLNLFAYTGSFSVYANDGGARSVTTVDMSKTYCQWAEHNLNINGFECDELNTVEVADCLQWLAQAKKERKTFDLIICDPPTFSNSKKMREASFSVDRDYPWLLADMCKLLRKGGKILFSNNSRSFEFDAERCPKGYFAREVSKQSVPQDFRNDRIHRSWWIEEKRTAEPSS